MFAEDLDPFLMDESGEVRNRIKFVQNIIRPYVEYYTGSVIRMSMTAQAQSISALASDRREKAYNELMFADYFTRLIPSFASDYMRERLPLGETPEETSEIFHNLWKDQFEEDVNVIMDAIATKSEIEDKKVQLARNIALDGIGILFEDDKFGEQVWEVVDPQQFFFDVTAKRPDLRDAEFMGEWCVSSLADILEKYPELSPKTRTLLEEGSRHAVSYTAPHNIVGFQYGRTNGKIPRYRMYWRDIEEDEWGIVLDDNNTPCIKNLVQDDRYTERDLIPNNRLKDYVKDNTWIERVFKMKNKKIIPCDIVRYVDFIPQEFIANAKGDIVLGYGIRPYQTKYSYQYNYPDYPYKCYCWALVKGEILSPIDDLISPQRFLNRLISMAESQINNFRGSGVFYDKDMIDPEQGEEGVLRSMNLGKPIGVNANGQLNNSVIPYGNQLGTGTLELFNVAQTMKAMAESIIGGGESLMGQGGAYRASATVAQQNLTQGTTMQEPVFYAINKIILQAYESMANRGRRILCDSQSRLTVTIGEKGVKVINLSKEFDIEQFRVKIVRSANPEQEKQAANEMLMALLERQLISHEIFAEYYNKANLNSIGSAIRKHSQFLIESARIQTRAQQKQMAQEKEAAQAQMELNNLEQDKEDQFRTAELQAKMQGKQQAPQQVPAQNKQNQQVSYGEAKLLENLMSAQDKL